MATDKSINIRQVEATEKLAVALTEIDSKLAKLTADVAALKALLVKPESKFQVTSSQVAARQGVHPEPGRRGK